MEYTIEIIQPNEADQVLDFLKSSFMKEEPFYKTLDLLNDSDSPYWQIECIPNGRSFKAVNSQGELIAVLITSIDERINNNGWFANKKIDDTLKEADRKMQTFMNFTISKYNLFEMKPNIDRAVELVVLSVSPSCRGLGIGRKLFDYAFEWIRTEQVATVVYCVCSSYFSAQICQKYGMELVYRLPYADYVVDGKNPILPEHPHVVFQIFIKEV